MFQRISAAESASVVAKGCWIANPSGCAETIAAVAPSPNWSWASKGSTARSSWRWRLESSTVTTSTFASGSERTTWWARRSEETAA
jgi:hypothetical protein